MVALGFKEIIWDMGWIWIIILTMTVAFIIEEIKWVWDQARDKAETEKKPPKPRYEVIFRQRIE